MSAQPDPARFIRMLRATDRVIMVQGMSTTIAIVGSRHWTDEKAFRRILLTIPEATSCGAVVTGAARGVDWMAARWARETGRYLREYPPLPGHRTFTAAAHERNQKIVDDLVICREKGHQVALIAMPGPTALSTYDTIRRAERAGIRIIIKKASV